MFTKQGHLIFSKLQQLSYQLIYVARPGDFSIYISNISTHSYSMLMLCAFKNSEIHNKCEQFTFILDMLFGLLNWLTFACFYLLYLTTRKSQNPKKETPTFITPTPNIESNPPNIQNSQITAILKVIFH